MLERNISPEQTLTGGGKPLIEQIKKESPFNKPEFYKPLIFDVLALGSALWLSSAYLRFLDGKINLVILIASLAVFSILSSIEILLTKAFTRRIIVIIIQTLCLLLPFGAYSIPFLAVTGAIVTFFIVWGELLAYGELESNIEVRFFKTLRPFLKKLTTALVLFMLILYLPRWDDKKAFIPKENFDGIYGWAAVTAKNFYPEVDFNSTFVALTRGFARIELEKNPASKDLDPASKERIISQTSAQIGESISKSLGVEISDEELTKDVFYNSVLKMISNLKNQFNESFLLVWTLIMFLIIRGFGIIFYWIVMPISFILYELLLSSGFIHLIGVSKTHEVVDF